MKHPIILRLANKVVAKKANYVTFYLNNIRPYAKRNEKKSINCVYQEYPTVSDISKRTVCFLLKESVSVHVELFNKLFELR